LTLLNDKWSTQYSIFYKWDENGVFLEGKKKWKVVIKNTLLYSDFTQISNDIYYTNPWKHVIYRYNISDWSNTIAFWNPWVKWYSNTWAWLFNTPTWLVSNWANLYVSDSWNNIIRKINVSNWLIEKVAWSEIKSWYNSSETLSSWTNFTDALFDYPTWITYSSNKLYVSDSYNNRIRMLNLSNDKVFTLAWTEDKWFNLDNWTNEEVLLNYPLGLIKAWNWIIFWDTANWKIRYYNETNNQISTLLWIEKSSNLSNNMLSKYNKVYNNSYLQKSNSWFYYNNIWKWIIYEYDFWDSNIWNNDDKIKIVFWNEDNNLILNWDFENDISSWSTNNDIITSDNTVFYTTSNEFLYPIFWSKYLWINTIWKIASWTININNNFDTNDSISIYDKVFKFTNWNYTNTNWNVLVSIWGTISETIENFKNELNNYNIVYTWTWNQIMILANTIWDSWNSVVFSGSSLNYSLLPNSWHLSWWVLYGSWSYSFSLTKNLEQNQKYKLTFYIASDQTIFTQPLFPLLDISTWSWNIDEKVLNVNNKWYKKEFIFDWKWNNQKIEFFIKSWVKLYIDNMKIENIWKYSQYYDTQNLNMMKIWILNSFYFFNWNLIFTDIIDKSLKAVKWGVLSTINNDFLLFDIKTFILNLKNDYISNSDIEILNFENKNNNLIYDLWKFKISNNMK
jgi:hypothetical protein